MARVVTGTLYDADTGEEIRDTNPHDSVALAVRGTTIFQGVNTTDQTITVQFQGSFDGDNWEDIGTALSLTDGSTTPTTDTLVLSDPWPRVRAQSTAGANPASGNLQVHYSTLES